MTTFNGNQLSVLDPSGIGEFVKHDGCLQYANLRYKGDAVESERNWKEAFQPLGPLLSRIGEEFESEKYDEIEVNAESVVDSWKDYDSQDENNEKILSNIEKSRETDKPILLEQAKLVGEIGPFDIAGDADLIVIWPNEHGIADIRVFDIKAAWDTKPYHQIQTATYSILLKQLFERNNIEHSVSAGIITRETEFSSVSKEELPSFSVETRESDVFSLLEYDGPMHEALSEEPGEAPHQFGTHCHDCPNNEACFTHAIETLDLRLLELTRGEQEVFESHGIETLSDLAKMAEPIRDAKPYEYEYPEIYDEYEDLVADISAVHSVGERLPLLAQKAQSLLGELKPDEDSAHDKPWAPWIVGSGQGALPEDDPHPSTNIEPCTENRGALIRVYLNVQWDYLQDKLSVVAGRVNCANYDGTPLTFSESITEVYDSPEKQEIQESELLESFFDKLFGAIQTMGSLTGQRGDAPVHLYFYTSQERDALMDSVKRHSGLPEANSVRDLLGLRSGVDQSMVSVLQDEIKDRLALKTVSSGILHVLEQTYPDDEYRMDWEDWKFETSDGEKIQLRDAFYHRLFDYSVPFDRTSGGIDLSPDNDAEGFYAARGRFDAQIPLEYVWACEEVGKLDTDWTDDNRYKGIIEKYMWTDTGSKNTRISLNHVTTLAEKLCQAAEHVERGLKYKNPDINKPPIDIDALDEFSIGDSTLATSCIEYLDLEYSTTKQDTLKHYQKPVKQRILSGKSVPLRITDSHEKDGLLYAEGELIYDQFGFSSPDHVAKASRQSGGDGSSSGSWMVATPLENSDGSLETAVNRPEYMMNSTPVSIETMDADSMEISIRGFPNAGSKDDDYRTWHKHFTTDSGEDTRDTLFADGEVLILDPSCDDLTSQRAATALEDTDNNTLYNEITDYLNGESSSAVERFNQERVDEFVDWLTEHYDPSPNPKQQEFIQSLDGRVSLLQGPPGTGKTSGAIALAVLARAYASESQVKGLVTGASNKAVDETMADVADALSEFKEQESSSSLDDMMLVRLVGDEPPESEKIDGVCYVNYHEESDSLEELYARLKPNTQGDTQSGLGEYTEENTPPHVMVFATPSRTFGLAKKLADNLYLSVEDVYSNGINLFDLYAADEASMLPIPQLLLGGAFMNESAGWQALITGDQRQMSPVQTHEWRREDRRTIEEIAPFLSALNYFRFLRGEEIDALDDENDITSPDVDIPITRLQETYRCHKTVADFLQRWVYSKDNIQYSSNLTYTIDEPKTTTGGIGAALEPESPITLVMHDDTKSQQSNPVEASIARELVDNSPDNASIGVVTPHNSQKGLLQSVCSGGQVDTVERFQGGERDIMIVSATVSDPDYLSDESKFILNPNRLNVALSRMKKKLIVLAPKSLFRMIPGDIDEYEDATIWKGLYSEVSPNENSDWSGELTEFTDRTIADTEASLSIHSKD
jgi:broad-specificity NMP kinase